MKISIHRAYANFEDGYLFDSDEWDEFVDRDDGEFLSRGKTLWKMMSEKPGSWVISCQPGFEGDRLNGRWDFSLIEKMLEDRPFPQERGELFDFFAMMDVAYGATHMQCVKIAFGLHQDETWVGAAEYAIDGDITVQEEGSYGDAVRTAAKMDMEYNDVSSWVHEYVDLEALFGGEDELHVIEYAGSFWAIHDHR